MLSWILVYDLEVEQMYAKTTFLHGELEETIYMKHPEGYIDSRYLDKVRLLKKSLYGHKQSHTHLYKKFDDFVLSIGF